MQQLSARCSAICVTVCLNLLHKCTCISKYSSAEVTDQCGKQAGGDCINRAARGLVSPFGLYGQLLLRRGTKP